MYPPGHCPLCCKWNEPIEFFVGDEYATWAAVGARLVLDRFNDDVDVDVRTMLLVGVQTPRGAELERLEYMRALAEPEWSLGDAAPWESLPGELFGVVVRAGSLSVADVARMAMVCHAWRDKIAARGRLWKAVQAWNEEAARCRANVLLPAEVTRQYEQRRKRESICNHFFSAFALLGIIVLVGTQLAFGLSGFGLFSTRDASGCQELFRELMAVSTLWLVNFFLFAFWLLAGLTFGFQPRRQRVLSAGAAFAIVNTIGLGVNAALISVSSVIISRGPTCMDAAFYNLARPYAMASLAISILQLIAGALSIKLAWDHSYGQYISR